MNDKELIGKVHSAVYHQCKNRGFAAPVDVLMDVGYLSKQDYENWRYGRVDYLERVCKVNLSKLSLNHAVNAVLRLKSGIDTNFK